MERYQIARKKEKNFEGVSKAQIGLTPWGGSYQPDCFAQVIYVEGEGFYGKLSACEKNPKAVHQNYYDLVCQDSCLEWFVDFRPEQSVGYLNLEANSKGVLLCGLGASRHGRTPIDQAVNQIPGVTAGRDGDYWWVEYFLPLELIEKAYGKIDLSAGAVYRGNFYKCGDLTEVEHYLTWAPIHLPNPDFHCPDYFGEFVLE